MVASGTLTYHVLMSAGGTAENRAPIDKMAVTGLSMGERTGSRVFQYSPAVVRIMPNMEALESRKWDAKSCLELIRTCDFALPKIPGINKRYFALTYKNKFDDGYDGLIVRDLGFSFGTGGTHGTDRRLPRLSSAPCSSSAGVSARPPSQVGVYGVHFDSCYRVRN